MSGFNLHRRTSSKSAWASASPLNSSTSDQKVINLHRRNSSVGHRSTNVGRYYVCHLRLSTSATTWHRSQPVEFARKPIEFHRGFEFKRKVYLLILICLVMKQLLQTPRRRFKIFPMTSFDWVQKFFKDFKISWNKLLRLVQRFFLTSLIYLIYFGIKTSCYHPNLSWMETAPCHYENFSRARFYFFLLSASLNRIFRISRKCSGRLKIISYAESFIIVAKHTQHGARIKSIFSLKLLMIYRVK